MRFRNQLFLLALVGSMTLIRSMSLRRPRPAPRRGRPVAEDRFLENFYNIFSAGGGGGVAPPRLPSRPVMHNYPRAIPPSGNIRNMKYLPQQDRKPATTNNNLDDDEDDEGFSIFPSMPSFNLERATGLIGPFKESMEMCKSTLLSNLVAEIIKTGGGSSLLSIFSNKEELLKAVISPTETFNKYFPATMKAIKASSDVCLEGLTNFLKKNFPQKSVANEQTTKNDANPVPAVAPQAAAPDAPVVAPQAAAPDAPAVAPQAAAPDAPAVAPEAAAPAVAPEAAAPAVAPEAAASPALAPEAAAAPAVAPEAAAAPAEESQAAAPAEAPQADAPAEASQPAAPVAMPEAAAAPQAAAPVETPQAAAPSISDTDASQLTTADADKSVTPDAKPDQAENKEAGPAPAEVHTEPAAQGDLPKKEEPAAQGDLAKKEEPAAQGDLAKKEEPAATEAKPADTPAADVAQPETKKDDGNNPSQVDAESLKPSNRGMFGRRHRRYHFNRYDW